MGTPIAAKSEMGGNNSQVALLHHISSLVSSDQGLEKILQELISLTMEQEI